MVGLLKLSLLLAGLVVFCSAGVTLRISDELPELEKHKEGPRTFSIHLAPKQLYRHASSLLTPIPHAEVPGCNTHAGTINLKKLGKFPNVDEARPGESYVYAKKHGIVYRMNAERLTAYKYSPLHEKIEYIESIQFSRILSRKNPGSGLSEENKCLNNRQALSPDEDYLFVFSCNKIVRVDVNSVLAKVETVDKFSNGDNGISATIDGDSEGLFDGNNKLIYTQGMYIWSSWNQGTRVYGINYQNNLTLLQKLEPFTMVAEEPLSLYNTVDIAYSQNKLYVLTAHGRIEVYSHNNSTASIAEKNYFEHTLAIELVEGKQKSGAAVTTSMVYHQIVPLGDTLYISGTSKSTSEEFIMELQFDVSHSNLYLVRYYKNFQQLSHFSVFQDHLLVAANHIINLYERNQDPRLITRLLNGVSNNHLEPARGFHRLTVSPPTNNADTPTKTNQTDAQGALPNQTAPTPDISLQNDDLFVIESQTETYLAKMQLARPYIECNFEKESSYPSVVEFSIPQRCTGLPASHRFNQYCINEDKIKLYVAEDSSRRHVIAIASVFVFCAFVVGLMMVWRKEKIMVIEKLVTEINKLRRKQKEKVEFVEEYIEGGSARENNWDDIRESYGTEENVDFEISDEARERPPAEAAKPDHEPRQQQELQEIKSEPKLPEGEHLSEEEDEEVAGTDRIMFSSES